MSKYVDGFLIPIKPENIERYTEIAQAAGAIWKEHGALEYIEAAGDDLKADKMVSFLESANAKDDETVIFAFIVFESKEERDRINGLVMADERMNEMMNSMKSGKEEEPFDYTKMAYGGFKTIVAL